MAMRVYRDKFQSGLVTVYGFDWAEEPYITDRILPEKKKQKKEERLSHVNGSDVKRSMSLRASLPVGGGLKPQ